MRQAKLAAAFPAFCLPGTTAGAFSAIFNFAATRGFLIFNLPGTRSFKLIQTYSRLFKPSPPGVYEKMAKNDTVKNINHCHKAICETKNSTFGIQNT